MTKISFELFGMTLLEPMALFFNWILCAQALFYYYKLQNELSLDYVKYWRGFFVFFAASTFFGGLSHLFYGYLGLSGKIPGWITGIIAISFLEMTVATRFSEEKRKLLTYIIAVKFVAVLILLSIDFTFVWVMIQSATGLLLILGISSIQGVRNGQAYSRLFLLAILSMIMALPFRLLAIDLHLWFNRDDIGHIFMMITIYLFYRGTKEAMEESLAVSLS